MLVRLRIFNMDIFLTWSVIWSTLFSLVSLQALPSSSPAAEFLSRPVNRTVLEGAPAVLRCKIRDVVHTCQWFYLEPGLSFYDDENTPVLVKEFRPTNDRDCSIKFNKARRVQNGQWLCKGLQVHQRKYIVSDPVFLRVIVHEANMPKSTTDVAVIEPERIFRVSDEGHIVNTELGESNVLSCNVNKPIRHCSWIAPNGKRISMAEASLDTNRYEMQHNLSKGECPIFITNVSLPDEGNWRCVVNIKGEVGERVGPLIHLHLSQFGKHHLGQENTVSDTKLDSDDNSLQAILIGVSILLLLIVVVLVILICKRGSSLLRKRTDPQSEQPTTSAPTDTHSTPSNKLEQSFSPSFIPTIGLGRHHIPQQQSVPNHYTRYLDMTGRSSANPEAYVMFPPGTRAPVPVPGMSSLPLDRNSTFSGMSSNMSLPDSQRTMITYDNSSFMADPYYIRQGSLYNGSHLYEEIDERHARLGGPLAEDGEGYMLPRNANMANREIQCCHTQEQHPTPAEHGYAQQEQRRTSQDVTSGIVGYSVPKEAPIPTRNVVQNADKSHIMSELSNCTPVLV